MCRFKREMKKRFKTKSPEETCAVAAQLAGELRPGSILAFHGELGSGKTCFIQGLAAALGVEAAVSSPTYTIVNEYRGRLPLHHMDLYRVSDSGEALHLGLDDYLYGDGVTAIEWPEVVADLLPPDTLHIWLRMGNGLDEREIFLRTGKEGPP